MKIYVNDAFVAYVSSFFGVQKGDATYAAFMDLNSDGIIDLRDINAWVKKLDTWISIKPETFQEWFDDRPDPQKFPQELFKHLFP